jgi:hypothetical protein
VQPAIGATSHRIGTDDRRHALHDRVAHPPTSPWVP